ncbi:unnamed protein product [Sphagnum balticum]
MISEMRSLPKSKGVVLDSSTNILNYSTIRFNKSIQINHFTRLNNLGAASDKKRTTFQVGDYDGVKALDIDRSVLCLGDTLQLGTLL